MIRHREFPAWITGISAIFFFSLAHTLSYLRANSYSVFRPESAVFVLLLAFFPSLVFVLFRRLHLNWIFWAMLLLFTADLTFGIAEKLYAAGKMLPISRDAVLLLSYLLPGGVLAAFTYAVRRKVEVFCFTLFLAVLVSTLIALPFQKTGLYSVRSSKSAQPADGRKKDIFFLLLDEHIGLDGIPQEFPAGASLRADLLNHYRENGFVVFPKAFSNYYQTYASLRSIFNARIHHQVAPKEPAPLQENRVFAKLKREGFAIQSYQSTWIDFCNSKEFDCRKTFTFTHNSMGRASELPMPLKDKLRILWDGFVFSYHSKILQTIQRFKLHRNTYNMKIGVLAADRIFEELKNDAKNAPRGTFFFAHLSMPHHSYVYDSECNMKPVEEWENREIIPSDPFAAAIRQRKYGHYVAQVSCLHKKLDNFFQYLDEIGIDRSATVILMGDHGSRIALHETPEQMLPSDYADWFSAFLAIRPGEYNSEFAAKTAERANLQVPVARVIAEFFHIEPQSSWKEFEQVYLPRGGSFQSARMPELPSHDR